MLADTVLVAVRAAAREHPTRVAIQAPGRAATTYADLIAQVDTLHVAFARHGIGRGTRVATLLPNGVETAVASLAVATGATCVPLNPAYTSAELAGFLADTGASLVLTDRDLLARVAPAAEQRRVPIALLEPDRDATAGCFRLDLSALPETGRAPEAAAPGDVALVLHTSGSTAKAKIVPLTQRNLVASMANLATSLALTADDVCLNMMPLFHVGALVDLLLAPLSVGGSVVVTASMSSATFFDCLAAFRPTWYQGVPTMLQDVVGAAPDRLAPGDKTALRFVRAVSAPLPTKLQAAVEATFSVPVVAIYGMTETAGVIASNPLPPAIGKPGSVGKPVNCDVAIADGEGNAVAPGERGEVIVSGDNVMAGYEGTADRRQSYFGRWLRTGDEGYLDGDGFLFLTGRIKDIVNRGGEKIAPREIDECLMELAGVREAAAYAVPHPTLGEDVAVAVVAEAGMVLSQEAVRDHLAARLSRFKVPRHVTFVDALPRLPGGKLDRRALAAGPSAWERTTSQAPASPLEERLVGLWKKALQLDALGTGDNFFDLGGDSLKATTLVMDLEDALGRDLPPGILFDAPTVAELAARLSVEGLADAPAAPGDLPPALYKAVVQAVAGWKGARSSPGSLLVGRNTLGAGRPLFWACTQMGEYVGLAEHLDPERPVYAMRSLAWIGEKSKRQTMPLARHYVGEIRRAQPEGPYLVGGFCEGTKLAFDVAALLRGAGHEVALLVMHDGFVPTPYDGEVAMYWTEGLWAHARDNASAELGWRKFYTGPLSVFASAGFHTETYVEPAIATMAASLEAGFARVADGRAPDRARRHAPVARLDPAAYRAQIRARVWPFQKPGKKLSVAVTVMNRGPAEWQPTATSGILLGARWRYLNREVHSHLAAYTEIAEPIAPGESRVLTLDVTFPACGRAMILDVDLLEEGIGWFRSHGARPPRLLVFPLPRRRSFATDRMTSDRGRSAVP